VKCYKHPDRESVGICGGCGNPICAECNVKLDKDNCCKECKEKLAGTVQAKPQSSKSNKWLIGTLIGCGGFMFLLMIGGILAAMLIPALAKARESARRAVCTSSLRQIGAGLMMYSCDYEEQFPENLFQLYPVYVSDPAVFWCPSDSGDQKPQDIKTPKDALVSYKYIPGLCESDSPDSPLIYEDLENHNHEGGNVLFVDGHVEWKDQEELKKLIPGFPLEQSDLPAVR